MSVQEIPCPTCEKRVALCDNNVLLDVPAVSFSEDPLGANWRIMQLSGMDFAAAGGPGPPRGHTLHEHQPLEGQASDV